MGIDELLKDAVAAGDVPGVAATAATDKGIVFEGAAGSLDLDSVIWIASMTKAVTGAAAMQLVERGKLPTLLAALLAQANDHAIRRRHARSDAWTGRSVTCRRWHAGCGVRGIHPACPA